MIFAAAIAAAAALIGAAIASGDEAKAQGIRMKLAEQYGNIPLPNIDKLIAQKLPPDAAARYSAVTQSTQAESDVLGKYQKEINNKGETPEDRAAYLRMQQEAGGIANGAEGAVQRNMANRGLAGSGMSFALQEQGAQAAANRANAMGINEASDSRGRYMQALGAAGDLSGKMRGQELQAMSAQDQINEFNARQQWDADLKNNSIPQQNFDNAMSKQAGVSNAQNGVANGYQRGADNTRKDSAAVGGLALTAGQAYEDKKKKPDFGEA